MRKWANEVFPRTLGALFAVAIVICVLGITARQIHAQTQYPAPSWTGGDAYQAILNYNNYFYSGQTSTASSSLTLYSGEAGYNNSTGNGQNFGVIFDTNQSSSAPYWHTFWTEAEQIEVAEDAYWWAANTGGNPGKYLTEINDLAEGFIDEQYPTSNFCSKTPPWSSGSAYCWHGSGYTDIEYAYPISSGIGNGGDWFNDDLMWASMAFARAWRISYKANPSAPVAGWLTAARNTVDYVWANAQAQTNAANGGTNGTEVGLLQAFCNTNKPQDGVNGVNTPGKTCVQQYGTQYTGWRPNLDAEVNFTFVIAAKMIADDLTLSGDTTDAQTYKNEAAAVWAWTKENLIDTTSQYASTCTSTMTNLYNNNTTFQGLSSNQTCAEVYDANSSGTIGGQPAGFDGEAGYWNWLSATAPALSTWDFSMNYGTAIQAAIRMGEPTTAQELANYLMYGLSNPNHGYAGNYEYGSTGIPYSILPNYGQGGNFSGSNGIALRGLAYGLFQPDLASGSSQQYLDTLALKWAQANMQAAFNNANSNYVMWNDWAQDTADETPAPGGTFNSWDCSDAVAGMLTIGTAATPPGGK